MRFRDRLNQFMVGRYGMDAYSRFISGVAMSFIIFSLVMSLFRARVASTVFSYMGVALVVYAYFRIFSRNFNRRYMENQKFLMYSAKAIPVITKYSFKLRNTIGKTKYDLQQRRIYHIYKCPTCSQKIRIPRGKGRIQVKCPKCYTEFIKNS